MKTSVVLVTTLENFTHFFMNSTSQESHQSLDLKGEKCSKICDDLLSNIFYPNNFHVHEFSLTLEVIANHFINLCISEILWYCFENILFEIQRVNMK